MGLAHVRCHAAGCNSEPAILQPPRQLRVRQLPLMRGVAWELVCARRRSFRPCLSGALERAARARRCRQCAHRRRAFGCACRFRRNSRKRARRLAAGLERPNRPIGCRAGPAAVGRVFARCRRFAPRFRRPLRDWMPDCFVLSGNATTSPLGEVNVICAAEIADTVYPSTSAPLNTWRGLWFPFVSLISACASEPTIMTPSSSALGGGDSVSARTGTGALRLLSNTSCSAMVTVRREAGGMRTVCGRSRVLRGVVGVGALAGLAVVQMAQICHPTPSVATSRTIFSSLCIR